MMTMNLPAVLAATVAGFIIGAIWYMSLARQWLPTQQWTEAQRAYVMGEGKKNPTPFVVSFIGLFIMAAVLSALMSHMGGTGIKPGMMMGALCWLGFVATTFATGYAYSMRPFKGWLIDAGHYFFVLIAQGAILGWFTGG